MEHPAEEPLITHSKPPESRPAVGGGALLGAPERRTSFDVLRVIAIVGVVAIHTFSRIITTPSMDGTWQRWIAIVLDLGFVWAVPVFVMLSGALILRPASFAGGTSQFYRRRALRILPALVFWHVIYLVVVRMMLNGEALTIVQAMGLVVDGRAYTQLYFLWVILGLYLVAPLIAAFINEGSSSRAFWLGACALAGTILVSALSAVSAYTDSSPRPISTNVFTMWIPYVGYFVLGYAISRIRLTRLGVAIAAVAALILAAITILQYGQVDVLRILDAFTPVGYYSLIVALLSVAVCIALVGIFDRITFRGRLARWLRVLSDASFGVFLVHLAIIAVIARVMPQLLDGTSLVRTSILFVVTLVVSYGVSMAAGKVPYLRRVF